MKSINIIKRYPNVVFFVLTFIVSWIGIVIISFFTGMPASKEQFESIAPIAMLPLVLGPPLVALLFSGLLYGKEGLKKLLSRIITWKANVSLYALALLTLPILASGILLLLSQFSSDFIPKIITEENKAGLLITGLSVGICLTLFEEIGWSGFATPELRKRYGIFLTGLILGALWGAWHFLPLLYGCGDISGKFDLQVFYPGFFFHYAGLIPFRIIMVWLYDRTHSIVLPWIMHATLTACAFFILNISKIGFPLFIYYLVLAICLWIITAVILILKKK